MALASMSTVQLGLALSVPLIDRLGALATWRAAPGVGRCCSLLGLGPAAPARLHRRDLLACTVLGVVTAGMMVFFMLAIARLPLGTASALEFLGPLAVVPVRPGAAGASTGPAAAALGVVLLTEPWHGGIELRGLGFAAGRSGLLGRRTSC